MKFSTFNVFATGALGLISATQSLAAYPEQQIKLTVAYAPGGGTDLIARLIAPVIAKNLGNSANIIVINRAGAGGAIGFAELAKAPPDGHTIGFINTPNVLTSPIERKANFHWTDFDLLGNIIDDPGNFSVHGDSPHKTLQELVNFARANPGAVTYGTSGVGSDDHLAALMLERAANIKLTHIPFKGAAEVHNAVMSRQIVVGAINIGEALQYARGGSNLRHLGQMSAARTTLAPNVPTFREQGFDVIMASLRGMAAPKGLPPAVREALVSAIQKALVDPDFQAKSAAAFAPVRYLAPAAYSQELREAEAGFKRMWETTPWGDK